jgi:hypothetical protein
MILPPAKSSHSGPPGSQQLVAGAYGPVVD